MLITTNYLLQVVIKKFSLGIFKTLEKLIKDILSKNMTIDEAKIKQIKYVERLDELRAYPARGSKYIGLKESVSKNVKKIYTDGKKLFMGLKM